MELAILCNKPDCDYYRNPFRKGLQGFLARRQTQGEYQLLSVSQRDLRADPARFNNMLQGHVLSLLNISYMSEDSHQNLGTQLLRNFSKPGHS